MDEEKVNKSLYKDAANNARIAGLLEGAALGILFTVSSARCCGLSLAFTFILLVAALTFAVCLMCEYAYWSLGKEVEKWQ